MNRAGQLLLTGFVEVRDDEQGTLEKRYHPVLLPAYTIPVTLTEIRYSCACLAIPSTALRSSHLCQASLAVVAPGHLP